MVGNRNNDYMIIVKCRHKSLILLLLHAKISFHFSNMQHFPTVDRADECGPVYVMWLYSQPLVVVAHPDIIKVSDIYNGSHEL